MGKRNTPEAIASLITENINESVNPDGFENYFNKGFEDIINPYILNGAAIDGTCSIGVNREPGEAETPPSFSSGGNPASDDSYDWQVVDIIEIEVSDENNGEHRIAKMTPELKQMLINELEIRFQKSPNEMDNWIAWEYQEQGE